MFFLKKIIKNWIKEEGVVYIENDEFQNSNIAIEFVDISKSFKNRDGSFKKFIKKLFSNNELKEKKILDSVSFSVIEGTIHGFIGSNGSGKTTTFLIIAGLLDFDNGFIKIKDYFDEKKSFGLVRSKDSSVFRIFSKKNELISFGEWNENISYVFSSDLMFSSKNSSYNSSVKKYLKKIALLRSIDEKEFDEKIKNSPIHEVINNRICDLSLGWKKILQISIISLFKSKILFLDEPFNGLDLSFKSILIKSIMDFKNKGGTVVISTHIMEDLEKIADFFTIISGGKILFSGENKKDEKNYIENTLEEKMKNFNKNKKEWNF